MGFVRDVGRAGLSGDAVEFFQLVEKADGQLYWLDLDRLLAEPLLPLDTDERAPSRDSSPMCMPTSAPSRRSTTAASAS